MHEFKKLVQPVNADAIDIQKGKLELMNRRYFTGLEDIVLEWMLEIDGDTVQKGIIKTLKANPGQKMPIRLNLKEPEVLPGQEVYLYLCYILKKQCKWADSGHKFGWDQFRIKEFEKNSDRVILSFHNNHLPDISISEKKDYCLEICKQYCKLIHYDDDPELIFKTNKIGLNFEVDIFKQFIFTYSFIFIN